VNHHLTVNEPSLLQDGDNPHTVFLENFGLLTPMLAEELTDLEADYTRAWLVDAMRLAVLKGVRNLRYVGGILRRWKAEGRKDKPDQPAPAPAPAAKLVEFQP
jgi:DnaD/phage-associated family protein